MIRPLKANEIECRVDRVFEKGITLLLYKDARADMKLMDEAFGETGWKRTHSVINGHLFCNVAVWDKEKGWVEREDVGVESFAAKEKGEASDAFKRACVNWGIGRELYESPLIYVNVPTEKEGTKWKQKNKNQSFKVKSIGYKDGAVTSLSITDKKTNVVVFKLGDEYIEPEPVPVVKITPEEAKEKVERKEGYEPICADCKTEITIKVHDHSIREFGRPLCFSCQRDSR